MSTTEQKVKSQEKSLLGDLSTARIYDFLYQDDEEEGIPKAEVLLRLTYKDAKSDSKTAYLSRKDLMDRGFGLAQRRVDITTEGEKLSSGIVIQWEDDEDIQTT
jgi:hypothetical protein